MTTRKPPTLFRIITSFVAFSFLVWTLSSSTFLDASADLVDKSLSGLKNASDQTLTRMISLSTDHIIR